MKKIFSLFAALIVTTCLWAANFKCGELYYDILSDSTVSVTYEQYAHRYNYNEIEGDLIIPSTVTYNGKTYTVTSIGTQAFTNCPMLSVTIPSSVKKIGMGAFNSCTMLTNVTIPNSVTYLGDYAFKNCYQLQTISISDNVTSIGEETFVYCKLRTVTFGKSISNIHETAFNQVALKTVIWNAENYSKAYTLPNCVNTVTFGNSVKHIPASLCRSTSISSISIPNSVTSIGDGAFDNCRYLTSVTIPNSVTSIGSSAFEDCSSLTSVTIGESVTSIGKKAFAYCSGLTSVTLGNSVTSIGNSAFSGCSGLTSITIPNSVTSIGDDAFRNCSGLTSITIPNSVTSIGSSAFAYCSGLTSFTIPDSVESVSNATFYECSSLSSVTLGHGVTNIGYNAFRYCSSLTSITIGKKVKSIGNYVFAGCSQLTNIICNREEPPIIESMTFDDMAYLNTIYVPCGAVAAYQSADGWSRFKSIKEPLAKYSIALIVNDERMGAAHVDSNTECGAQISATANYGYQFIQWSDGNTDNPRTLELIQDTLLTAEFAANQYSITTHSSDSERGITQGDTTVNYLEYVTISAIANYGYHFSHWNDGNSDNPRVVKVTKDQTYMADFYKNTYHIITNCDDQMGSVSAPQSAEYLDEITISATANYGYHFVQWSDGVTDNPRTLELTQDTILIAEFAQSFSGQCGDNLYWELVDTTLHITGSGEMYDYTSDSAPWKLLVSSIKVLTIAEDVTKIGYDAFDGCTALVTIVWNAKHAADAYNDGQYNYPVFYGICSQITSFTLGENVEYIPSYLCSGMENLTSVTIPNSVTSIGDYAFNNCTSLTSMTIPNNVTSIGNYAFEDCSSLTSVTIPNSVTSIGEEAFAGCSSLTSVTIGESVTSIGTKAFYGCSSLTSVTINSDAIVNKQYSQSSNLSHIFGSQVTEYVIGDNVIGIGSYAFRGCSSLTSVTIPNSVTSIGTSAFEYCSRLTSVTIGNSVTSIGDDAFDGCSSLTSINIPNSVTSIGDYTFRGCSSLTSVTIGNSVTSIGNSAFRGCSSLTSVTIPESVTTIGESAFYECSSLTSVTINSDAIVNKQYSPDSNLSHIFGSQVTEYVIGDNVTSIGGCAFAYCSSLTSITIPNSVTSIGNSAFYRCSSLTSVTIPNGVTSIGKYAFRGCSSLTSVTIPESVTSIGNAAFDGCSSLTKTNYTGDIAGWCNIGFDDSSANPMCYSHNFYINEQEIKDLVIPNSVDSIHDYAFYNCSSLTSVTIGESVTSIGEWAFYNCSSLTSVIIGESVTSIGWKAFYGCSSLTSVTIGESVKSIGAYAFSGCSSLTSITCKAATPPTISGTDTFYDVSTSIPVYVPCESIQSYREHNQWGRFQNLQCVKPEDPNPEDPQDSEMCLNSADERAVFFQGEEFGTSANVYMWDPANDNKELVGSWPGSAATHLGDGKFKFVIPTSVTGDPSTWMIIWNNGIGGTQTENLTFTMHGLYNMSGVQSVITTLCDGSNTDDPNEEVITCAEAVSICQQTGTTATTKEYTIRGYVTKIEAAYSEQYDNITFWMADTSPTQMDNSSNSVTSISDYPNIALGKSTTASSSQNSGTLPEYINDGNFNTRWSSEWQDNEYITIDLEQYSFIDHITLHWETAYASQFAILITDEQPSSSTLSSPLPSSATCYQSSGDVQTIPVAKSGRYITLIGIERATAYGISLYELEAYGMPLLQAYCVKPIQSTDKYVQIGDYVEAVGTLVNYGGTTPEINAGGTYTILTTTTAVENTHIQSSMTNCQKIIRNGQLIILRDGKTYNVMGQEL